MADNFFNKYPYTDFHEMNLDWILKTIRELESEISDLEDQIGDLTELEINVRLNALENYCDRLHNAINSQYIQITNEYQNAIANASNNLITLINNGDASVRDYVDNAIANLPGYYMYNPYTGVYESITDVMMSLYNSQRIGITAADYDALDMTASYYDGLNKTAYDYDMNGI